jgi:hypothetical protein
MKQAFYILAFICKICTADFSASKEEKRCAYVSNLVYWKNLQIALNILSEFISKNLSTSNRH